MNSKRQHILHWAEQGYISPDDVDTALSLSHANPDNQQWFQFIKNLFLWLGVISLAAGTLFFFAFNWDEMSNLVKFALMQTSLVVSTLIYTKLKPFTLPSTAIAFLMVMLIGALLALSGQIYQTGADPWQLFAFWALFMTPIAVTNRASTLWLLWVLLINLSCYLYYYDFRGVFGILLHYDDLVGLFLLFNTLLAIAFEVLQQGKTRCLDNRLVVQTCLLASGIAATWLAIWAIFDEAELQWGLPCYLVWILCTYLYYRYRLFDLFIISGCVTSTIVIASSLLIYIFNDALESDAFLIIAIFIIGLSSSAGIWLKKLSKEHAADQPITSDKEHQDA